MSVLGIKLEAILPFIIISSVLASPNVTVPFKLVEPLILALPVTSSLTEGLLLPIPTLPPGFKIKLPVSLVAIVV